MAEHYRKPDLLSWRELGKLCREIDGCRHSLHPVHGAELEIYVNIAEYLWLARRKTEFDLAEAYYTQ